MAPKVSVIIPVYNGERFIASSIKSLKEQTFENIEIIIVDDSSTDSSYDIAKTFETKTCKVLRQDNAGAAVARNLGLKMATGDYIQFLDVDDFLSKDKIEKQVKALIAHKNKVAVCNFVEFFDEEELYLENRTVDQSAFIYSSDSPVEFLINLYGGNGHPNFIQTNCWLTPKHLIDKVGGWKNNIWLDDDGEFFARVLLGSEGVISVSGVYNYYRRSLSETNLSNITKKKYIQNALLSIDLKHKYLLQYVDNTALRKAMATQYLNFAVYSYPKNRIFSKIAYRKYKSINVLASPPKLGGRSLEIIKRIFGWKTARLVKFYLTGK